MNTNFTPNGAASSAPKSAIFDFMAQEPAKHALSDIETLAQEPVAPPVTINESLIENKAILVTIDFRLIGRTRQLGEGDVKIARTQSAVQSDDLEAQTLAAVDTDAGRARVVKTLWACDELRRIESLDRQVTAFVERKCLPCPIRATYLVPLGMIEVLDTQLSAYATERAELVAEFVAVYPRLLVKTRRQLRELFDLHDYPSRDCVAECFGFAWRFIALGVPDALGEISSDIWEREREKAAASWAEMQEQAAQLLRVRLRGMLDHLCEKLQPDKAGKPKILRASTLTNLNDFMNDFNALNITNDAQLAAIVGDVRQLMSGIEPETLRKSDDLRAAIHDSAKTLEAQLTTLIVDKPRRMISLEED